MKSSLETFKASVVVVVAVNAIVFVFDHVRSKLDWWFYPGVMLLALGAFCLQRFVRILVASHEPPP
jgi:hypothetical protein